MPFLMEGKTVQIDDSHRIQTPQLDMPPRLLMGPGPSNVHPRVRLALSLNEVGHLDPKFNEIMDETH